VPNERLEMKRTSEGMQADRFARKSISAIVTGHKAYKRNNTAVPEVVYETV
jgi:hypothetical protein